MINPIDKNRLIMLKYLQLIIKYYTINLEVQMKKFKEVITWIF